MEGMFNCKAQGMHVFFDPASEQQVLTFQLALNVSLPQLLQQLIDATPRDIHGAINASVGGQTEGTTSNGVGSSAAAAAAAAAPSSSAAAAAAAAAASLPGTTSCSAECQIGLGNTLQAVGTRALTAAAPASCGVVPVRTTATPSVTNGRGSEPWSNVQRAETDDPHNPAVSDSANLGQSFASRAPPPPPPPLPEGALASHLPRVGGNDGPLPVGLQASQNSAPPPMPPATLLARSSQPSQVQDQPGPVVIDATTQPLQPGIQVLAKPNPPASPRISALVDALRANNLSEARTLLQQRADINGIDSNPNRPNISPLLHVLEAGANVEAVNLMLKARADVDFLNSEGETPLHFAMRNYATICPLVIRMLLHAQADLNKEDMKGISALETIRVMSSPDAGQDSVNARQVLNEVSDHPTIDIVILDSQEPILSALFADTENDRIIFNTASSIGVYSLAQMRVVFVRKLRQKQVLSSVKSISVNPELGTLAICLEVWQGQSSGGHALQNIFIIWPSGQLQDEEPLKLSINVDPQRSGLSYPARAILSRSSGPQLILGRLVDSKVYSWHLDSNRVELKSETELSESAGNMALSDDGCWIALVCQEGNTSFVKVFTYEGQSGIMAEPLVVWTQARTPQAMAIQQHSSGGSSSSAASAHLALMDPAPPGGPPPPIEIMSITTTGNSSLIYRLKVPSACSHLSFCHGVTSHLASSHVDGLTVFYDLQKGTTSQCHCAPDSGSLSVSSDRTLAVVTEYNCFRIFKVPSTTPPQTEAPTQLQ
eukprot:CAMPEP_0206598916 /NCGR_PEP_ID=MMETSP0325_2-20121206/44893_1 /ASSEMBLY_ACC=CAM_ASM_000347 /TAXON_ID=2866 /ORGANISM="Crypthecodinium cohnii, Strain Seligo" /LENGTH=771 /DNA_ID=CAMNT_0054109937 /DNA_START=65 /DNA_END=2380 /DNA_ORIENTATION=-